MSQSPDRPGPRNPLVSRQKPSEEDHSSEESSSTDSSVPLAALNEKLSHARDSLSSSEGVGALKIHSDHYSASDERSLSSSTHSATAELPPDEKEEVVSKEKDEVSKGRAKTLQEKNPQLSFLLGRDCVYDQLFKSRTRSHYKWCGFETQGSVCMCKVSEPLEPKKKPEPVMEVVSSGPSELPKYAMSEKKIEKVVADTWFKNRPTPYNFDHYYLLREADIEITSDEDLDKNETYFTDTQFYKNHFERDVLMYEMDASPNDETSETDSRSWVQTMINQFLLEWSDDELINATFLSIHANSSTRFKKLLGPRVDTFLDNFHRALGSRKVPEHIVTSTLRDFVRFYRIHLRIKRLKDWASREENKDKKICDLQNMGMAKLLKATENLSIEDSPTKKDGGRVAELRQTSCRQQSAESLGSSPPSDKGPLDSPSKRKAYPSVFPKVGESPTEFQDFDPPESESPTKKPRNLPDSDNGDKHKSPN